MCPRTGCKNKAEVSSRWGILPCLACQKEDEKIQIHKPPEFATLSQSNRINQQRDVHGADILQPWTPKGDVNREFVKHYPDRVDDYYSKKQLKKL